MGLPLFSLGDARAVALKPFGPCLTALGLFGAGRGGSLPRVEDLRVCFWGEGFEICRDPGKWVPVSYPP